MRAEYSCHVDAFERREIAVNPLRIRCLPIHRGCQFDFGDALHTHPARQIHFIAHPLLPVFIRVVPAGCDRDARQRVRRLQRQRLRIVRAIRHRDHHCPAVTRADNRHGRGRERHAVLRAFAVHMQCAKRFPCQRVFARHRIARCRHAFPVRDCFPLLRVADVP